MKDNIERVAERHFNSYNEQEGTILELSIKPVILHGRHL